MKKIKLAESVAPVVLELTFEEKVERELKFQFERSSGPGGQNVNKVNSKAICKWNLGKSKLLNSEAFMRFMAKNHKHMNSKGEFVIYSDRFRDQGQNKTDCRDKIVKLIKAALKSPKKRKPTKTTRSAKERRLNEKKHHGEVKKMRKVNID